MNALELNANSKFPLLWLKKFYHQMDQLLLCLDNLDGVRVNNLLDDSALILLCFVSKSNFKFHAKQYLTVHHRSELWMQWLTAQG